jgi:PAS domain S-box-containing protein
MDLRRPEPTIERAAVVTVITFALAAPSVPPAARGTFGAVFTLMLVIGMLVVPDQALRRFAVELGIVGMSPLWWPLLGILGWGEALAASAVLAACYLLGSISVSLVRRALVRSEQTRLEIYRRVPVGLFRTSAATGRLIEANPALVEMLGYSSFEDLASRPATDLYADPDDRTALHRTLAEEGGPQRFAHRLRRADGSPLWVRGYIQEYFEHGRLIAYEGIIEDVTQRREAEEASREMAARLHTVFHRAPIALWEEDFSAVAEHLEGLRAEGVTDLAAYLDSSPVSLDMLVRAIRFVDVNPAGVALLGAADRAEALLAVAPRPLPSPVAEAFRDQLLAIWDGRDAFRSELTGHTVYGTPTHLELHWAADVVDGRADYTRVVVAIIDIGIVKQAEQELAGIIRSKDELVASVSHELRTPIGTIMGMALELRDHDGAFVESERREMIGLIADQSRELSDIVEDLLVATRADPSTLSVRPEVVDVPLEIERIVAASPLRPELVVRDRPVFAWADPLRLRQIIRNLLSNAERYGAGNIRVEASRTKGAVVVRVIDNGPGVPRADRERVFQPYARVSGIDVPGSIGLGLPVSRKLARLMEGDLEYAGGNPTTFELRLPAPGSPSV